MIEDVIGAGTRDAHVNTIERHTLEQRTIDATPQTHVANLIIVARTAIEYIYAYLRGVDAEVELLTKAVLAEANVLYIERIAEEKPSPSEVRTYFGESIRSKGNALVIACNGKVLVGTR